MNQSNQDFNYYTKGNSMFYPNYPLPEDSGYPNINIPSVVQAGVPMFPLYGYDNSEDFNKDVAYMKQLYPQAVLQIQKEVDEECDKLEYEGSCMFDEYPDKSHLNMIVDTIYTRVVEADVQKSSVEQEEVSATFHPFTPPYCDPRGRGCYPIRGDYRYGQPDWLRGLIGVLLFNEMTNRRRRYRSRRRWF